MGIYGTHPQDTDIPSTIVVNSQVATLAEALALAEIGDTIVLPPGTHDIGASTVQWPYGVSLKGTSSWRHTIITGSHATAALQVTIGRCKFENIWFKNTNAATGQNSSHAIYLQSNYTDWAAETAFAKWTAVSIESATKLMICTVAGTSGSTEPTWDTADGATTTDGTATWICYPATTPMDVHFSGCAFGSNGTPFNTQCGDRQNLENCVFTNWGEWAMVAATGHYESSVTPVPLHGLLLRNVVAENAMAIPTTGTAVGFLKQTDRLVMCDNVYVSMTAAANLAAGGASAGKVAGFWKTSGTASMRVTNSRIYITGASNNNESMGFLNDKAGGFSKCEILNCIVDGVTSHANGIRFLVDTWAATFGPLWFVSGGNINPTNWSRANALTPVVDLTGSAMPVSLFVISNQAAGADISPTVVLDHPLAATLQSAGIILTGAAAGIDDSNTVVITLKDGDGNTIVAKTYNTATQPTANSYNSLGALDGTHKVLPASDAVTFEMAQGVTADMPTFTLVLQYTHNV